MEEDRDKLGRILFGDLNMDRVLERLDDVDTLADIIHEGRVRRARSLEIALAVSKFVKEGVI